MWAFHFVYAMVSTMWGMTKFTFVCMFCLFMVHVAFAAPVAPAAASQQDAIVHQVETYFNTLSTFQAHFEQMSAAPGMVQEGVFYLERPKKFLWQYVSPQRQKLVSTGSRLFYVDEESSQVTQLPLSVGLAAVLTQPQLDFSKDGLQLVGTTASETTMSLSVALPQDGLMDGGVVTLTLSKSPLALVKMETVTALGQATTVFFDDIQQGQALDAGLFNYTPPQEDTRYDN